MKCPTCGAESTVIETRKWDYNTTKRRRQCEGPASHRFNSFEVVETVYNYAKHRAVETVEAEIKRAALLKRDIQIAKNLHIGWQALADKYQLTKPSIYRAAKRGRNAQMPRVSHSTR